MRAPVHPKTDRSRATPTDAGAAVLAGQAVLTGQALRARLALTAPALAASTARLWRAPGLRERYTVYVQAMHGVIRASVPLMERAAARCAELGPRDRIAAPLAGYLREHIAEERGHDEWLLADFAALGGDPETLLTTLPQPAVARLVGAQQYWIEYHHPVTLLGHIAVLEANAPAPWLADRIVSATGLPEAAVTTVREHAGLDTGHAGTLFALLDRLPLSPALSSAVTVSGLHTLDALVELFGCVDRDTRSAPRPYGPTPGTDTS
ncbi:iron-containing redox enzyme family protein [Streptomyces sp. NBC_00872]|uniref:iron-containing redox enzyme family protein n=1 Tax=Streptomyces sp. NBC_00872 TaxID=2903686 RepID=UPI003865FD64|nr:iron-containing redox enzyme family protein [Streptomyces sp. NBC_00872]